MVARTNGTRSRWLSCGLAGLAAIVASRAAQAADAPLKPPAAAVPETCKATLSLPSFGPTIKQSADPFCFPSPIGDIYVGGVLSGYAYTQTNPLPFSPSPLPSDRGDRVDFTNIQGWFQKADGPFQFYVQAGAYAIPALGLVNYGSFSQTDLLFTPLPVGFGKIVLNDNWSIQGGRMPTLIGSEAPFTFQNINIQRGLLFNQENTINQGVQINYSDGPVSVSVAGTDGFFSGELTWFTGSAAYKFDDNHSVGINGGLNLGRTDVLARSIRYAFATPLFLQNSGIVSVNYTYSNGPLTLTPYVQFTNVERDPGLGILTGASTYGGALLASYSFTDHFALAGRAEYIEQSGTRGSGTTSLLYGAGSSALSLTVTPTFTVDRFFVRGEYSLVHAYDVSRGDLLNGTFGTGFGRDGNRSTQERYMVEAGVTF